MADAKGFLTGGEQTTINATITELFPALAFNTGNNPKTPEEMRQLVTEMNLQDSGAQESFAAKSNVLSAKEYISQIDRIKPVGGRFLFMSNQFHASQPPIKNETRMTLNYNLRKHG